MQRRYCVLFRQPDVLLGAVMLQLDWLAAVIVHQRRRVLLFFVNGIELIGQLMSNATRLDACTYLLHVALYERGEESETDALLCKVLGPLLALLD